MKEKELIQKLLNEGLNNVEIGKIIKCDRNTVRRRMNKYKIERKIVKSHPNLKVDYFKKIDTKEKAYWLGFLYADGYVNEKDGRLSLDLSKKDLLQVEKFCDVIGASKEKIRNRIHKCGSESVSIRITSRHLIDNLVEHKCGNKKTKRLRFLDFKNEEMDLSFLMGLYDGDGSANSTELYSGGKKILEDIKYKFKVPFEIKFRSRVFVLNLGAELKVKMMKTYKNSMERKRNTYKGDKGLKRNNPEKFREISISNLKYENKFQVSKKELEGLINENTYVQVGKMFGVSDNAIRKRAKKLGIKLKPRKK